MYLLTDEVAQARSALLAYKQWSAALGFFDNATRTGLALDVLDLETDLSTTGMVPLSIDDFRNLYAALRRRAEHNDLVLSARLMQRNGGVASW